MDFALDARTQELQQQLLTFMDEYIYPAERELADELVDADPAAHWQLPPVIPQLQAAARARGLWNLFLPDAVHGAGLTNVQYAPLAEITGHSPLLAPAAINLGVGARLGLMEG